MASELITDDFNRADQELDTSVSAEGWAWERVNGGANFMRIDSDAGVDGTPGVRSSSGSSNRRLYRAGESIAGEAMGAQVDIPNDINSEGAFLALRVQDGDNYIWGGVAHATGAATIRFRLAGVETVVATDTVIVPAKPYTMTFYIVGGACSLRLGQTEVLTGTITDAEVLLFDNFVGIYADLTGSVSNVLYDNFNGGFPWLLGFGASPSTADASDPNVQRSILDEQRRANLMGGRASTILTSALGLADTVPTARVHLLGRC